MYSDVFINLLDNDRSMVTTIPLTDYSSEQAPTLVSSNTLHTKNLVKEDNEISKDWELNSLHEIQNV